MGSSISQNNKEKDSREREEEDEEEDEDRDPLRKGEDDDNSDEERVFPDDEDEEFEYETEDTDSEEKMQAEESDKEEEEANEKQQDVNQENGKHDDIQNDDLEHEVNLVKKEEIDENKNKRQDWKDMNEGKRMSDETDERSSKEIVEREGYELEEDTIKQAAECRDQEEDKKVKGSSEQDTDGSKKSVIKKLKDKMVAARVGIHWENTKKGRHIDQKDEETQVEQVKF